MVGLALRRYDPRIPGLGNRSDIRMKTIAPLPIYEGSPFLCTPDEMKVDPEIFACHARTNESGNKMINKFVQKSAAPLALEFMGYRKPRPDGRGYLLSGLRPSGQLIMTLRNPYLLAADRGPKGRQCEGPAIKGRDFGRASGTSAEGAARDLNHSTNFHLLESRRSKLAHSKNGACILA